MNPRRFVRLASVFILAVAVAFPALARADGEDMLGDGSDTSADAANKCSSGGPGASRCAINVPFAQCSITCEDTAFYACCKYVVLIPTCGCIYAP